MTFRVEVIYDLSRTCHTGGLDPDHATDVDQRTWTCRTCRRSVYIEVGGAGGQCFVVERIPARKICSGDFIVYRTNTTLDAHRVIDSKPFKGRWYLAVTEHGYDLISPGQFLNRLAW